MPRNAALIVLAVVALCDVIAFAGSSAERLTIGEVVRDFTARDLAGGQHSLSDHAKRHKLVVLAFNGVGCPISELYSERLEALGKRYAGRGVSLLGINSNAQDEVRELRSFVSRHELSFPVLKDHDHAIADLLGAKRTTEVFVVDASLKLVYRGRVDDQYSIGARSVGLRKDRPEVEDLANAIDDVLSGRAVRISSTEAAGCVIGRKKAVRDERSLTFHRDVEPIIQKRCQSCHREGEIAPFELKTHADVAGWSGMIREVVLNRRMPPWHAAPEHGTFANDRSLSKSELDTLVAWIDNGTPRGDPEDSPPPPKFTSGWGIGEPDAVFEMTREFAVPAIGTIDYQYFQVRTSFPEDRWIQAAEVRAGDRDVVHHILVFAIDPKNRRAWRRETGGGTRGYFAVMVPGERPTVYPKGMAKRLPAGATLVFQVHYTTSGKRTRDRSKIGLVFADAAEVEHEVRTSSAFSRWIRIPPKAAKHVEVAKRTLRKDVEILSLLPHMHLRGEAFRYEARLPARVKVGREPDWETLTRDEMSTLGYDSSTGELSSSGSISAAVIAKLRKTYEGRADDLRALERLQKNARTETLLHVPKYDFGWQNTYRLARPMKLPEGTVLVCRATFNNSSSNPALTRKMWEKTVRWGAQTWNEMHIGYFDYIVARDRD